MLNPEHSNNYDLLHERYLTPLGLVQAGFFYKDITSPIVTNVVFCPLNGCSTPQFAGHFVATPENAGSADVTWPRERGQRIRYWGGVGLPTALHLSPGSASGAWRFRELQLHHFGDHQGEPVSHGQPRTSPPSARDSDATPGTSAQLTISADFRYAWAWPITERTFFQYFYQDLVPNPSGWTTTVTSPRPCANNSARRRMKARIRIWLNSPSVCTSANTFSRLTSMTSLATRARMRLEQPPESVFTSPVNCPAGTRAINVS